MLRDFVLVVVVTLVTACAHVRSDAEIDADYPAVDENMPLADQAHAFFDAFLARWAKGDMSSFDVYRDDAALVRVTWKRDGSTSTQTIVGATWKKAGNSVGFLAPAFIAAGDHDDFECSFSDPHRKGAVVARCTRYTALHKYWAPDLFVFERSEGRGWRIAYRASVLCEDPAACPKDKDWSGFLCKTAHVDCRPAS